MPLVEGLDDYALLLLLAVVGYCLAFLYWAIRLIIVANSPPPTAAEGQAPPQPHNPGMCPICRSEPQIPVETNCAHLFCGDCLKTLWRQTDNRGSFSCPMCRTDVSVLFNMFPTDGAPTDEVSVQRNEISIFVRNYNYRQIMGGALRLWDRIAMTPILLRHLWVEMMNGQLTSYLILRIFGSMVICLVYFILQTDMFPESFYGIIGFLDDGLLWLAAVYYIAHLYRHFMGRRDDTPLH